jgi:putative membrane protein
LVTMSVLTDNERTVVEQCIAEVEKGTSAEIVVTTLARADAYEDVVLGFSALCSLALTTLVHVIVPELTVGALLSAQLALFFALRFAVARPALLRRVLPSARVDAAVAAAAERLFLAHRVYATAGETGVLILLCELEHRITVLGDRAAHAAIQASGWESHLATIREAVRTGRAAEGLCGVIRALGAQLGETLELQPDDIDELPNTVHHHRKL